MLSKIGGFIIWGWLRLMRLFEDHKYLHVTKTEYNSEGEVVDVITRSFTVRKFYKCSGKYMYFKTYDGTYVELVASQPMDYMTETIVGKVKRYDKTSKKSTQQRT
tara:strand:+ start:316 stop:630 length:315 start_codon:yes stop_codon:yes gene_type:complete